jgi:serine phosphatase RsbU (regulator of sigma subunit)
MAGDAQDFARTAGTLPGVRVGPVLLVEDDDGDAFLVAELLDEAGAGVDLRRVRTLREGLDALAPDVACVLLDLDLPDASGLGALRDMLDSASDAAVIVLTGLSDRAAGVEAMGQGAQDYLVKGEVDGELLVRAIRYAVERRQAARRLAEAQLARAHNARIQRGLLPRPLLEGADTLWAMRYLPGGGESQLGGDFLDAVLLPDGTLRAVIGDVCGHGPDEAAVGAGLRIAWRTLVLSDQPDGEILVMLERILAAEREDPFLFVTVCDITISPDRRRLSTRLAGHPAPLVLDGVTKLADAHRGPPLGVGPDQRVWRTGHDDLPADAALLLFTDGLIEGRTSGRRVLGVEGLAEVIAGLSFLPDPDLFLERVIAQVQQHNGGALGDDVACLLLAPAAG